MISPHSESAACTAAAAHSAAEAAEAAAEAPEAAARRPPPSSTQESWQASPAPAGAEEEYVPRQEQPLKNSLLST
jgi:L-alanine-DL-glutamate epimerase-like enolase superfamily enzyme